jgi:hypothetical protein
MRIARSEPHETPAVDHRDEARATELSNLKLALATFAVQLDAFEMRMIEVPPRAGAKPGIPVPPADIDYRLQEEKILQTSRGKNTWRSIRSLGSKSDG